MLRTQVTHCDTALPVTMENQWMTPNMRHMFLFINFLQSTNSLVDPPIARLLSTRPPTWLPGRVPDQKHNYIQVGVALKITTEALHTVKNLKFHHSTSHPNQNLGMVGGCVCNTLLPPSNCIMLSSPHRHTHQPCPLICNRISVIGLHSLLWGDPSFDLDGKLNDGIVEFRFGVFHLEQLRFHNG